MRSKVSLWAVVVAMCATLPASFAAQTHYKIVVLPTLGGTAGQANSINNRRWATGLAHLPGDNVGHAALWVNGSKAIDIGALGGAGANSAVAWPIKNDSGIVVGISDTAQD